jgi:hypothetical protein
VSEKERQTATGKGDHAGRGREPLFVGITDGVAAGYKALEYVLAGLAESVRLRRRTGTGGGQAGHFEGDSEHPGAPLNIDELVHMFAKLLYDAGEVVQEVANYIGERTWEPGEPHPKVSHDVVLTALPGRKATGEFHIDNTSGSVLSDVELIATDLAGDDDRRIPAGAVVFDPASFEKIGRRESVDAKVSVTVPPKTAPDTYYGLILARPGRARVVLQLKVGEPKKARAKKAAPAKPA